MRYDIRVMTYNIHSCIGARRCVAPEVTAEAIRALAPDVAALQEVDETTGGRGQAHLLADALEMPHVHFWPSVTRPGGRFGIAVLSRLEMRVIRSGHLNGLAPIGLQPRSAVHVQVETASGPLHLINTHLGLIGLERRMQAAQLVGPGWVGAVPLGVPTVLCGDFNAVPLSPTYRRVAAVLRDTQSDLPRGQRRRTFPSARPMLRLDHIFVSGMLRVLRVEVPRGALFRAASDHLPVVADLEPESLSAEVLRSDTPSAAAQGGSRPERP